MTTRLLLVRHGEAQHTALGISAGPNGDKGLTGDGREQVRRVARRLATDTDLRGAPVYASTLARGRETGSIIAEALGSDPPIEHCGLCSYHVLAEFDGRPHADAWAVARRGAAVALFRPEHEGGDTWAQLVLRAGDAFHAIAERHPDQTVVIATHNETIQASLVVLGYLPFLSRMQVSLATASITEWATDDDPTAGGPPDWTFANWRLARLNDTAHLEPWATVGP